MADNTLIPPMPNGVIPGSSYWNDWIEKLRSIVNAFANGVSFSSLTGKPTTLDGYGITDAQKIAQKNQANGYAGLDNNSRTTAGVKTTDYIIADSSTSGLTMKSPNGHYWLLTISNAGAITTTDLGTTSP